MEPAYAAYAPCLAQPPEAIGSLLLAVDDPDDDVRRGAAYALGGHARPAMLVTLDGMAA